MRSTALVLATEHPPAATTSSPQSAWTSQTEALTQQVATLTEQMTNMAKELRRGRSRARSRSRGRPRSRTPTKEGLCYYHSIPPTVRNRRTPLCTTMHIPEKRVGHSLLAANDNSPTPCRLYVTDRNTRTKYLVDTGSDVSIFPQTLVSDRRRPETYELFAANGFRIITYDSITIKFQPKEIIPVEVHHSRRWTTHHRIRLTRTI